MTTNLPPFPVASVEMWGLIAQVWVDVIFEPLASLVYSWTLVILALVYYPIENAAANSTTSLLMLTP